MIVSSLCFILIDNFRDENIGQVPKTTPIISSAKSPKSFKVLTLNKTNIKTLTMIT